MKLKLSRTIYNISIYKIYFYCRCSCAFIAMETWSPIDLMGKVKIEGLDGGVSNSLISKNLAHYSLSLKFLLIL